MLELLLELTCPTVCTCLFKLRPGVLSKTLSHIYGKLNLHMFLFNVGLFTLINVDSLIFLAKFYPPSLLFGSCYDGWGGLCGYCVDEWVRGPSGALCIFHQRSWRFPLCIHHHKNGHHIGTNIWLHFGWPYGLCPWGRLVSFWWYYYLWSRSVCHTYHRSSWCFHRDPVCRVWLCDL